MERFHKQLNGCWVGDARCNDDGTNFRDEDVTGIEARQAEDGLWFVAIDLKDGREIVPDYTAYGCLEDAARAASWWNELIPVARRATNGHKQTQQKGAK